MRPMLVPPAATACHEWAGVPGTQQAVLKPAVGHDPGDVTDVGRPLADLDPWGFNPAEGFERKRLLEGLTNLRGERLLRVVVAQVVQPQEVLPDDAAQRFVRQDFDDSAQILGFELGLGRQRPGLAHLRRRG